MNETNDHLASESVQDNNEQLSADSITESAPDSDSNAAPASSNVKSTESQLQEEKDKFLRLYAEFENFRRRSAKERIDLIGTANSDLIRDLLPVLDDFERAIESNKTLNDMDAVKFGFDLLHQKLTKILNQKGLAAVHVKGEMFDAEVHEAIAQSPVEEADLKGKIIDEVECGYKLHDKTLRHPKVIVGS